MLYLITPTGNRFLQFSFCVQFMQNQDYSGNVTWVIADDGQEKIETPSIKNWNIIHIKRAFKPGNTQGANLVDALKHCPADSKILIIEDDDFYSNRWLSIMSEKLESCDLCGETRTRYYNIINFTYRQNNNSGHSSLCSTGLHNADAYKILNDICHKKPRFIDIHLWHNFKGKKCLFNDTNIVGIKGFPGKKGIGSGHNGLRNKDDIECSILHKWVGDLWAKKYIDAIKDI